MKRLNRIREVAKQKAISGMRLAALLGRNPSTVNRWALNKTQPSIKDLILLAECLDVLPSELINDEIINDKAAMQSLKDLK